MLQSQLCLSEESKDRAALPSHLDEPGYHIPSAWRGITLPLSSWVNNCSEELETGLSPPAQCPQLPGDSRDSPCAQPALDQPHPSSLEAVAAEGIWACLGGQVWIRS